MSIHTCSYYCDRPECIQAQRDELRQKLEQAEKQEPVAWINKQELAYMSAAHGLGETQWKTNLGLKPEAGDVPLYTAPRGWVGLSTGEARELYESDLSREELIHKIDEFLEEKNNG